MKVFFMLLCLCSLTYSQTDTLIMRNGSIYIGTLMDMYSNSLVFVVANQNAQNWSVNFDELHKVISKGKEYIFNSLENSYQHNDEAYWRKGNSESYSLNGWLLGYLANCSHSNIGFNLAYLWENDFGIMYALAFSEKNIVNVSFMEYDHYLGLVYKISNTLSIYGGINSVRVEVPMGNISLGIEGTFMHAGLFVFLSKEFYIQGGMSGQKNAFQLGAGLNL